MPGLRVERRATEAIALVTARLRYRILRRVQAFVPRICALGTQMRPVYRSGNVAGPALTVRTRPGGDLILHKAIDMPKSGDVTIVDAAAEGDLEGICSAPVIMLDDGLKYTDCATFS